MVHTPGPWAADARNGIVTNRSGLICKVVAPSPEPENPSLLFFGNEAQWIIEGNTNLIAASPEMYEVCIAILDWAFSNQKGTPNLMCPICNEIGYLRIDDIEHASDCPIGAAWDAVSKARGEQ